MAEKADDKDEVTFDKIPRTSKGNLWVIKYNDICFPVFCQYVKGSLLYERSNFGLHVLNMLYEIDEDAVSEEMIKYEFYRKDNNQLIGNVCVTGRKTVNSWKWEKCFPQKAVDVVLKRKNVDDTSP